MERLHKHIRSLYRHAEGDTGEVYAESEVIPCFRCYRPPADSLSFHDQNATAAKISLEVEGHSYDKELNEDENAKVSVRYDSCEPTGS